MQAVCLDDFQELARARLDPGAFDYYAGGAGDELTLRDNRAALQRIRLRPRVLVDVLNLDLSTTVLGQKLAMPVIVAPMAYQGLAHPEAERATAAACADAGTIFTMSTLANAPVAEVAAASNGRLWFQLYMFRDRGSSRALVQAAERAGVAALVLTVDAPQLGRRERDVRRAFALPEAMRLGNLSREEQELLTAGHTGSSIERHARTMFDASLSWDDVAWLQAETRLPVLLKGIMRGDDADRAVTAGAAGIVVSNHGGRQLDGAVATIDALPEIVAAVAGRIPVLVDGGFRRGVDVVKALALGAQAVLIGRPILWGLAIGGRDGVGQVLSLLQDELRLAMSLCGCPNIAAITPDLVYRYL